MRKKINAIICLALFTALSISVKASTSINDSLPRLEIRGKISAKSKNNGTYRVELLFNNIVMDSKEVKDEDSFSFILPSNKDYIVKIYKKGYATKQIGVNTGLHKYSYSEKYYKYEFVTEMEEILMKSIEIDSVENPLNMTGLENKENSFNYRRKYAKKMRALP